MRNKKLVSNKQPMHMIPSFFIIGERKCGTSSLYRYICDHPQVLPGKLKEPNFFGNTKTINQKTFLEYLKNFPRKNSQQTTLAWPELDEQGFLFEEKIPFHKDSNNLITGEASANTLVDGNPETVKEYLPNCKILILLREPVQRTFSHYRMYQRFKADGRSISFELLPFDEMIQWEFQQISAGHKTPFIYPSLYIKTIPAWFKTFGSKNVMVRASTDLNSPSRCQETMQSVFKFLEIAPYNIPTFKKYNKAPELDETPANQLLNSYFEPYNQLLFEYLGRENLWA